MNAEPNVTDRALAQTDEAIAVASSAIADLWTMTAQRNELLAALKQILSMIVVDNYTRADIRAVVDYAEAVVAKAEGRQ